MFVRLPSTALRPLALAIPLALGSLTSLLYAPQGFAAEQIRNLNYDIPAGPLASQLNQFAAQSGIYLAGDGSLTAGKTAPALQGSYSIDQALQILLGDNGLEAKQTASGRYELRRVPEQGQTLQLDAITVIAKQESAWGPVDGYIATRSSTGTKTDTSLLETPQTINVITADEIKARGAQSISDALRYTAGMTLNGFPVRVKLFDEMRTRGFSPTPLYLDGLHLPYGGGSTGGALQIDPYALERIEVLKGPASVLYGQNQPGGIVNMVSKRPTETPLHQLVLGAGSHDSKSAAFDFGGPVDEDGNWFYRLTGVVNDSQSEIDYAEQQRKLIAPSLTWHASDATTVTLFAQFQEDDAVPEAQGLPASGTLFPNPNGKIDRDLFLGEPGVNDYDRTQYVLGYEFAHQLNNTWLIKQNARYAYVDDHYVAPLHGYRFVTNPVTGIDDMRYSTRYGVNWSQTNRVLGIDNIAQAEFETGALQHRLLIGADYYRFNSKFAGLYDYNPPIIDLFNPVYGQPLNFGNLYKWDNTIDQRGAYLQDQIKWENWVFTLGGRYDWAETDNKSPTADTHTNTSDEKLSVRAGMTYLFDNGLAPYLSYSESFLPLSGTDAAGSAFEPSTGKQYEAGIKYQPPGRESFVQMSVYDVKQANILTSDVPYTGFSNQSGASRSQGIELEGKAAFSKTLNVIASVTRNDTKYTKDDDGREGRHPAALPGLQAALWLDYQFMGDSPAAGLGIGLGARYMSDSEGSDYADSFTVPSYTIYDAALTYDLARSPMRMKGIRLALNVENLDDKRYVATCSSNFDCYYGQGRTLQSSLTYDW